MSCFNWHTYLKHDVLFYNTMVLLKFAIPIWYSCVSNPFKHRIFFPFEHNAHKWFEVGVCINISKYTCMHTCIYVWICVCAQEYMYVSTCVSLEIFSNKIQIGEQIELMIIYIVKKSKERLVYDIEFCWCRKFYSSHLSYDQTYLASVLQIYVKSMHPITLRKSRATDRLWGKPPMGRRIPLTAG